MERLPIDDFVPVILDAVRTRRAVVVTAAPGAGKTTRVPPALAADGPVLVLQPRRVAARSMAARVAAERGWTLGREVGWHVRFDRKASAETQVLYATEGILTARLQSDPLLDGVRTVVIDEFHERSIHADLGIALAKQAWRARDDLRLVVMSATIDAGRVAAYLDDAPVIDVPGRLFPLDITYAPDLPVERAVIGALDASAAPDRRAVLVFLPGAGEIARAMTAVTSALPTGVTVWPLHGGLEADAQDAALRPTGQPRVILATNLAETTLTVPDVSAVVDTGIHKVARYDAERAIDRLVTERIPQDAADQRAGRAGRVAAGRVWRLWDARDRLRPHRDAEILRIDLASTVLDIAAWGGDPFTPGRFEWFEAPPPHALEAARTLLAALGALDADGRLTPLGVAIRRVPAHPRLARLLLADGSSDRAARAVAWLSEGRRPGAATPGGGTSRAECDVLAAVEGPGFPRHLDDLARSLVRTARALDVPRSAVAPGSGEERFQRALLAAYPDRVARRRERHGDRFALATGTGARLGRSSLVHHAEFIVAVDVHKAVHKVDGAGGPRRPRQDGPATAGLADEPTIVMASRVDETWLVPTLREVVHTWDSAAGKPRAARVERYFDLVLSSHPVAVDPVAALPLVWRAWAARERTDDERQLVNRLRFAADQAPFDEVLRQLDAAAGRRDETPMPEWWTSLDDGATPLEALPADVRRRLAQAAPATLVVPSGREHRLEYRDDGSVVASVKLQELFGLARTPELGQRRVPVTFELLAPNGRPVQVTRDLASFWTRGYPDVRKELRGRYPKHPWPDDPWSATPTARAKPRGRP